MPSENAYAFFGRVYPERTSVEISGMNLQHTSQFGTFQMHVVTHGSQILIEAQTEEETDDIYTLKNLVQSGVSSLTDPLSFLVGKHVDVEIVAVITPSGDKRVFGVEYPYISEKISSEEIQSEWLPKILAVYQTEASPYLQHAFTDFRLAMKHAEDTGFYCFRAVESLRQFFNSGDDSNSWKSLRKAINVDRATIEEDIQNYSYKRRHGDVDFITGEERQQVIEATWDIIRRFIEYAGEELEPIQEPNKAKS